MGDYTGRYIATIVITLGVIFMKSRTSLFAGAPKLVGGGECEREFSNDWEKELFGDFRYAENSLRCVG